jgi:hypothetical protein
MRSILDWAQGRGDDRIHRAIANRQTPESVRLVLLDVLQQRVHQQQAQDAREILVRPYGALTPYRGLTRPPDWYADAPPLDYPLRARRRVTIAGADGAPATFLHIVRYAGAEVSARALYLAYRRAEALLRLLRG